MSEKKLKENRNKKKKKSKKRNQNKIMVVLCFIFMISIGGCALLGSNMFRVENIQVKGNKVCSKDEIIKSLGISTSKNIFRYKTKDMENEILKNSYVDSAKVKRVIPNKFIITIKERTPVAILKDNHKKYYIDNKANVLKKAEGPDRKNILVDMDFTVNSYKKVDFKNEQTQKRLFYLLKCLKENKVYNVIESVNLRDREHIHILTKDNVKILLPNNTKLDYNISRLSSIIVDLKSKHINNGTLNLDYDKCAVYTPE